MKDELTELMHSEFTVSAETDIKHRVFSLLTLVNYNDKIGIEKYRDMYDLTLEEIEMHKDEYFKLRNSK